MQIGRKIIHLESVDSTNNYIANLLKEGILEDGTVILADEQFAGKGQRNAEWLTKPGENLTFSFFLSNVNLSVQNQYFLTCTVSISLVQLFNKFGLDAKIKWPNDIYVNNKKIAGVLIENQLSSSHIKNSIIGIGLNINQREFDGLNATSILLETEARKTPMEVLYSFIEMFNSSWKNFSQRMLPRVKSDYISNLFQLNELKNYEDSRGDFEGIIRNVLDSGHLVIERNGEEQHYGLKEIVFKL
ncbi:MAG: biotin--[acetyl-CoA-carboxylase] ligase [Crocinitomicaceae bacterium]